MNNDKQNKTTDDVGRATLAARAAAYLNQTGRPQNQDYLECMAGFAKQILEIEGKRNEREHLAEINRHEPRRASEPLSVQPSEIESGLEILDHLFAETANEVLQESRARVASDKITQIYFDPNAAGREKIMQAAIEFLNRKRPADAKFYPFFNIELAKGYADFFIEAVDKFRPKFSDRNPKAIKSKRAVRIMEIEKQLGAEIELMRGAFHNRHLEALEKLTKELLQICGKMDGETDGDAETAAKAKTETINTVLEIIKDEKHNEFLFGGNPAAHSAFEKIHVRVESLLLRKPDDITTDEPPKQSHNLRQRTESAAGVYVRRRRTELDVFGFKLVDFANLRQMLVEFALERVELESKQFNRQTTLFEPSLLLVIRQAQEMANLTDRRQFVFALDGYIKFSGKNRFAESADLLPLIEVLPKKAAPVPIGKKCENCGSFLNYNSDICPECGMNNGDGRFWKNAPKNWRQNMLESLPDDADDEPAGEKHFGDGNLPVEAGDDMPSLSDFPQNMARVKPPGGTLIKCFRCQRAVGSFAFVPSDELLTWRLSRQVFCSTICCQFYLVERNKPKAGGGAAQPPQPETEQFPIFNDKFFDDYFAKLNIYHPPGASGVAAFDGLFADIKSIIESANPKNAVVGLEKLDNLTSVLQARVKVIVDFLRETGGNSTVFGIEPEKSFVDLHLRGHRKLTKYLATTNETLQTLEKRFGVLIGKAKLLNAQAGKTRRVSESDELENRFVAGLNLENEVNQIKVGLETSMEKLASETEKIISRANDLANRKGVDLTATEIGAFAIAEIAEFCGFECKFTQTPASDDKPSPNAAGCGNCGAFMTESYRLPGTAAKDKLFCSVICADDWCRKNQQIETPCDECGGKVFPASACPSGFLLMFCCPACRESYLNKDEKASPNANQPETDKGICAECRLSKVLLHSLTIMSKGDPENLEFCSEKCLDCYETRMKKEQPKTDKKDAD